MTCINIKVTKDELATIIDALSFRPSGPISIADPAILLRLQHLERAIQDASRKQRTPLGERQGQSKLKAADVLAIRELERAGVLQGDIAARFAVAQSTVSDIVRRKKWPHI